jgi:hypothetical protein
MTLAQCEAYDTASKRASDTNRVCREALEAQQQPTPQQIADHRAATEALKQAILDQLS